VSLCWSDLACGVDLSGMPCSPHIGTARHQVIRSSAARSHCSYSIRLRLTSTCGQRIHTAARDIRPVSASCLSIACASANCHHFAALSVTQWLLHRSLSLSQEGTTCWRFQHGQERQARGPGQESGVPYILARRSGTKKCVSALIDFKKNSLDFTNECQLADNCWGIAEGKV
jgi:hypothetical protein